MADDDVKVGRHHPVGTGGVSTRLPPHPAHPPDPSCRPPVSACMRHAGATGLRRRSAGQSRTSLDQGPPPPSNPSADSATRTVGGEANGAGMAGTRRACVNSGLCLRVRWPRCRQGVRLSRDRGARRVGAWRCLSAIGDSGPRPTPGCASEHLGEPAFRERVAGLHAEPIRGHRRVIDSVGLKHLIVTLPADGDASGLTRRPPRRE